MKIKWLGLAYLLLLPATVVTAASTVESSQCYLKGLPDRAECFSLVVPENPADASGTTLTLHAARLPALTPSQQAPLVFLAGGPGQSAIEVGGLVGQALHPLLADRDIVLLEQRGTGLSNGFKCEPEHEDPYASRFSDLDLQRLTQTCVEQFDGDLSQYNTPNAIHDFSAMITALGYNKVHLYGGSYGTRAALVFMRLHPEQLASVTLDSMAPVQAIVGPFAAHGYRSLGLLFDQCEQTSSCAAAFPDLRAQYWRLWAQVSAQAIDTTIRHPTTLQPQRFVLDRNKLFQLTIGNLYSQQQRQLLPVAISQAEQGNFAALAGLMSAGSDAGIYNGLTSNIVCNEDVHRASKEQLNADTHTPFGDVSLQFWQALCANWPVYRLSDEHFLPVKSDIPVLALSGKLDPVTPPAWGELTVLNLSHATHLVADNAAHIVGLRGCGPKLIKAFIAAPTQPLIDSECLAELPGTVFMLSNNSP